MATVMDNDPSRKNTETQRTNYEAFAAASGSLRITEFYDLDALPVKFGQCSAVIIQAHDVQSGHKNIAFRIEHKDQDEYERVSILDEDEIISLDVALKLLLKNQKEIVEKAKTYTEITYRSRGGFRAGIYISAKREVGEYIDVAGRNVFLYSLKDFSNLVDSALFVIERLKSAQPPSIESKM